MVLGLVKDVWFGKMPEDLCEVDRDIKNEAQFPPENAWDYSVKYCLQAAVSKVLPFYRVSAKKIEIFREDAIERLKKLAQRDPELDEKDALKGFDRLWPQLRELLKEPAFYACTERFCMDSAFLYTYFTDLSGKAVGCEMALGYSIDITGRYRRIPECDGAYTMSRLEPTFRSFLERIWFATQMMYRKAQDIGWRPNMLENEKPKRKVKVCFLGGGLLPQIRMYGMTPETISEMFDITVYDRDPELPKYLEMIFGKSLEEYGIKFYNLDFDAAFKNRALYGQFDLVIAEGVMSYYKRIEQTIYMLNGAEKLLSVGGWYIHDLQILEPSMLRCVLALAWRGTGLSPDLNVRKALDRMQKAVDMTHLEIVYHEIDYYNVRPAIMNFRLDKVG